MTKQMQDKVCVVTGGAGSIGVASAKLLVAEGAKVLLVDLEEAALKNAAVAIGGGEAVAWCTADVTKSDQVKNAGWRCFFLLLGCLVRVRIASEPEVTT